MSKMASYESFGHLQPKLWAKEGPGVKLAVWLLTMKSRESTRRQRATGECNMALESSRGELQDWFRPRPDQRSSEKLWWPKVPGVQIGTISGLHFGSPGTKSHSGVGAVEQRREYYMGEGGESSESKVARGLSQHQKGAEWVLTNLWLVLDVGPNN
jgi:hypothetical protein